jgi:hypothetical protein
VALSIALFASVVSALLASFAILVVQLRVERARMEREVRSAKARRLRSRANGAEVMVPSITEGLPKFFHVFLSHV